MRTRRCVHITEVVLEYVQGNVLPGDRFPDDLPLNSFTPLTTPARTDGQPGEKRTQKGTRRWKNPVRLMNHGRSDQLLKIISGSVSESEKSRHHAARLFQISWGGGSS